MHFNLYLDDATAEKLKQATENSTDSRNAIIRKAINQWLDKTQKHAWPKEILDFTGTNDIAPFESHRVELKASNKDPFA